MLSQTLRPVTWDRVAGQKENIKILKAITKAPEKSPKTLIFSGAFGSGKTTCARIMARELNKVKDPNLNLDSCPFYYEYDSTVIGNVEEIRRLRDTFTLSNKNFWKVTVLDEVHAVSQQAQTALLKVFEEVTGNNIFILATTHPQKLLPTIRSRSLELDFTVVDTPDIIENLRAVAESKSLEVPDDIISLIAYRSGGHMRNAHMLLDKYLLLGYEDFKDSVKSAIDQYCDFFEAAYQGNSDAVLLALNTLLNIPKDDLKVDFDTFINQSMRSFCGFPCTYERVGRVVKTYGNMFEVITKLYFSAWFPMIWQDMSYFQAGMLQAYIQLKAFFAQKHVQAATPSAPQAGGGRFGAIR